MVAPKIGMHPDSGSSAQAASSGIKDVIGQESITPQDVNNPPANYYSYHYPGDLASFSQPNDRRDHQSMGAQGDRNSATYCMTGYNPYYTSTGYIQTPDSHGAEVVPCHSLDRNSHGNTSNGTNITNGAARSSSSPGPTKRTNGIKPSQLYGFLNSKMSAVSSNSKSSQSVASSNFPQSKLSKAGSYYQTDGYGNSRRPAGNSQLLSYQRHNLYGDHGAMGYRSDVRTWNGNDKLRSNKKNEFESAPELTCCPRGHTESSSASSEKEPLTLRIKKDKYNLPDFETEYEAAKFYVIKSYSEDDVHKSIKYDVWSSTAHGNKKLDAAFHDAEMKANETGKICPVFLFFSVNGSGQFVGLAEMVGQVDFNKTMDFWQMDKWSGFFPLKWHIVKDIPNPQLRHIILENNDNRPVTYTRDTQEIGLKQGLEMLKIVKSYSSKTSLLDDLDFYESREKVLEKRSSNSGAHHTDRFANKDFPKQLDGKRGGEQSNKLEASSVSALVNLANNLSLNNIDPRVV
ncbi:hypothetical protein vseg_019687 [Gypsophila vaccaria]